MQKAAEMALTRLELKVVGAGHRTPIRLTVGGIADPLNDPRIPALVVSIRQYQRTETVTIFGTDPDWRLAISSAGADLLLAVAACSRRGVRAHGDRRGREA